MRLAGLNIAMISVLVSFHDFPVGPALEPVPATLNDFPFPVRLHWKRWQSQGPPRYSPNDNMSSPSRS
jgi:hypothetical protein